MANIRGQLAGLKPPYVLMPYSCAGIYCEYYAAQYPNEIEALVLLDTSPTVESFVENLLLGEKELESLSVQPSKFVLGLNGILGPLLLLLMGEKQEHIQAGYTKDEILEMSTTPNHMGTLVVQMRALPDNLREVVALERKLELPVFLLSCGEMKEDTKYQKHLKGHLEKLGAHAKHMFIDGSTHSDIYWRRAYREIICREVDDFLNALR